MHSETCAIFPLAKPTCTTPSGTVSLAMPILEVMAMESTDPLEMTTRTRDNFEEFLEHVTVQTVESFFSDLVTETKQDWQHLYAA